MDDVNTKKAAVKLNIKNDRDLRTSKISAGNEASVIFRNIFCCN
jgi:hypothetical protein